MIRKLDKACPGDCSKCELLQTGEISDMVPCILDQIFHRVQENTIMIGRIMDTLSSNDITTVNHPNEDNNEEEE